MEDLDQYIVPYIISNAVFLLCIAAAIWKPVQCRLFLFMLFFSASVFNIFNAISNPGSYLVFGELTFHDFYKEFIYGYFARHISFCVLFISAVQLLISAGLLMKRYVVSMACLGGMIFGFAIAPLGIGSAFPSTAFMALAFLILLRNYRHDYIWNWEQYKMQQLALKKVSAA